MARGNVPLADRGVEVVGSAKAELGERRLEPVLGELRVDLAKRLLEDRAAEIDVLRALLKADEAADAASRLARSEEHTSELQSH